MSLLPLFQWLDRLPFNTLLRDSEYLGAANNLVHLLSLVVFFGAVAIVDLRLLGCGLKDQPLAQVARQAHPWLIGGFSGLFVTGFFALTATAMQQYGNPIFWVKMDFLVVALVFTFTVRHKVARLDETSVGRFWGRVVGIVSLVLWASVALSARFIMLL